MRPKLKTRSVSNLLYRVQRKMFESFQTIAAFRWEDDAVWFAEQNAAKTNLSHQVKFGNHIVGQYDAT
jgi:hypothetical protein